MKYQKHKPIKHAVVLCLTALLTFPPVSASAAVFADMDQVPWNGAEVPISQAAALGLMVGEVRNGQNYFRPRDSVSLCETAQLAYKLLLNTGKTTSSSLYTLKWRTTLDQYSIPNWARPAVAFCLEYGIVTTSELGGFMKNGFSAAATREQTVKILGRALVYGVPAYQLGGSLSSFVDNGLISSDARPYVILLEKEGVVNGDNLGKFNPKNTISRTETAVLVSNLYPLLLMQSSFVPPSSKTGQISEFTNYYISFKDSTEYYYFSASVGASLNGYSSSLNELLTLFHSGTPVTATLTLDGSKYITFVSASTSAQVDTEGKLTNVTRHISGTGTLILDGNRVFNIKDVDDINIRIDSKSKKYDALMKLHDDEEEMEAALTLDQDGYVTKISVSTDGDIDYDDDDDKIEGDVTDVDYDEDERDGFIKVDGEKYEIDDIDDINVRIDGKSKDFEDLYELFEDDEDELYAEITLDDDDEVKKIVVSTDGKSSDDDEDDDEDEEEGEITAMRNKSSDKGEITLDDDDDYDIEDVDDVEIDVEDGEETIDDWDELLEAVEDHDKIIEVTLTIEDDYVTEIKGEVIEVEGRLVDWSGNSLELEIDNETYTYKFNSSSADDIEVDIDGVSSVDNLDEFIDYLNDREDDNDLDLKDDDKFILTFMLDKGKIDEIEGDYND